MARLRSPEGCPWDRAQTLDTLRTFLIEEAYEVLDALEGGDPAKLREELGDLLFQIVFQARLAEEAGWFTLDEVAAGIHEKMVIRHPHVFGGDDRLDSPEAVLERWEKRKHKKEKDGFLGGVPTHLPALLKAYRLSDRAAQLGFDWERPEDIKKKLKEEVEEFVAVYGSDAVKAREELGDILFTLANIARHARIDPEDALQAANQKFSARFTAVLRQLKDEGRDPHALSLEEWDRHWEGAKINGPEKR
jgi:tetrapyrrole methylase family protein/MazG family protein